MDAGFIGSAALWTALGTCVIAVVVGRRQVLAIATAGVWAAITTLVVALIGNDFSLAYVAETTSLATPWPYRLAALWGGMDGSMLFYTGLTLAVGSLAVRTRTPVRVVAAVGLGLTAITLVFANPFDVLDIPAVDGVGLLAILQHPAMIYHPPILYLGLTTLVVPFALLFDHQGASQIGRLRHWMYLSWTFLTIGMAAGANWAYVELGWGGFWAWDPVENTALMPWLAITVFLHTSRVVEHSGRLRRWSSLALGMPFALSVMGVYLTRSGSTGSIHSFAENPTVGRILLIAAAVVAIVVIALVMRKPRGEPWGKVRLDRDGWIGVNSLLLSVALVFVTAGSAYPAALSVFGGETAVVDSGFFVVTVLPVAVLAASSLAYALHGGLLVHLATAVAVSLIALIFVGPLPGIILLGPTAASVAFLGWSLIRRRSPGSVRVATIAHLGMAIFLFGVAGSALGDDFAGSMRVGDTVTVGGHEITLTRLTTGEADRYIYAQGRFEVDGSALTPEIRAYEEQSVPVAEPALRSSPIDDVTIAVSLLFPDGETVDVSVFVRPLVIWVWFGSAVMALAGLMSLFSRAGADATPRRQATTGPLPAETTSDIAAH